MGAPPDSVRYRSIVRATLVALIFVSLVLVYWSIAREARRIQPGLILSDFHFLHRRTRIDEILDRLGEPSRTLGSGITGYQYDLADGRVVELIPHTEPFKVWIIERDGTRIDYFDSIGEATICDGTESTEAIHAFILSLEDEDPVARKEAAKALGCLGPEAQEAVPALIQTFGDEKGWVRSAAAWALGQMGSEVVPTLARTLRDQDANVRIAAAWALGEIGPQATEAIPALVYALEDKDETVLEPISWALGQIGLAVVPTLIQIVENEGENTNLRKQAAIALGHAGPEAEEAIPVLIQALEDENRDVRTGAEIGLWYITGELTSNVDWWKDWWEEHH